MYVAPHKATVCTKTKRESSDAQDHRIRRPSQIDAGNYAYTYPNCVTCTPSLFSGRLHLGILPEACTLCGCVDTSDVMLSSAAVLASLHTKPVKTTAQLQMHEITTSGHQAKQRAILQRRVVKMKK